MLFHSTRGKDRNKTFEEVLMQGLAKDGGLFMPDHWPEVNLDNLKKLDNFIDIAKEIVPLFTGSSFTETEVVNILDHTWNNFDKKDFIDIFEAIEFLFVEILFVPFDFIRLDISSWLIQNMVNFSFMIVIASALIYWTLELVKYDKKGDEKKDVTAHSFL